MSDFETEARQAADQVGRTALARIIAAWQRRFGSEFSTGRLATWLVSELHIEMADAENMDLERVAGILEADQRHLSDVDRLILDAMPVGQVLSQKEIAARAGDDITPTKVGQRLMENEPLKMFGFVVKNASGRGFFRRE